MENFQMPILTSEEDVKKNQKMFFKRYLIVNY